MKRKIMSTKRYEQVLDMLENDPDAIKKLTKDEAYEICHDSYAMKIAAATNICNLFYLPAQLRQNKNYMKDIIRTIDPMAISYCYKTWFMDKYFVAFCKGAINEFSKGKEQVQNQYNALLNMQIQKAKAKNQGIAR